MGQKKKKKSGGGRRNKGSTTQSKDHSLHADLNDPLSEEITALCAIFQDDCQIVSESPPQIIIKLRPYSKDTSNEDTDLSAQLIVRFLPGYPHKCPRLQINPEKGLSKDDTTNLESLLHDQANSNAKEGRVMIYNLVEAAQEFLSQRIPATENKEPVAGLLADRSAQPVQTSNKSTTKGPFVFGYIDLFSDLGNSLPWAIEMHDNDVISSSRVLPKIDNLTQQPQPQVQYMKPERDAKSLSKQKSRQGSSAVILDTVEEESESEDDKKTTSGSSTSYDDSDADNSSNDEKTDWFLAQPFSDQEDELSESLSSAESSGHALASKHLEKDLLMVMI